MGRTLPRANFDGTTWTHSLPSKRPAQVKGVLLGRDVCHGTAVLFATSALHLKRGRPRRGSSKAFAAWLIVGVFVLAAGIYAVGSTW
jgi:hypothetical protein